MAAEMVPKRPADGAARAKEVVSATWRNTVLTDGVAGSYPVGYTVEDVDGQQQQGCTVALEIKDITTI